MKASQAKEMKPVVDGLAAGERWQYLPHGEGWRDIQPEDHILLENAKRYRKKPEPRRFFVWVRDEDGTAMCAWSAKEWALSDSYPRDGYTFVEVVEVLK